MILGFFTTPYCGYLVNSWPSRNERENLLNLGGLWKSYFPNELGPNYMILVCGPKLSSEIKMLEMCKL